MPLLAVCGAVAFVVLALSVAGARGQTAAAACPADGCSVTVDVHDFESGAGLDHFTFVVNEDNTKLPDDPLALDNESYSPVVAVGEKGRTDNPADDRTTVKLPAGRYLITARSLDHKMWGAYIHLPRDAADNGTLTKRIDLTEQSAAHPLPLGKIRVFAFNDNTWVNGAPDTEETGLNGFTAELTEQTGNAVTVDYNNAPLCGVGTCTTSGAGEDAGFVEIPNLGPATYFIDVHPPEGQCNGDPASQWYQTTTIDGGLSLIAPTEEGADGTGAPGEQLWEPPNNRTAYWFGFVCAPQAFANSGTGEIVGTARNWAEWAPYTLGTFNEPVENPFIALSDSATQQTVYIGRGDAAGNFDIQNVPAGSYNISIWDEQLSYIMRFKPVTVANGQTVSVNDVGDDGIEGIGVSRWFGWLDGTVYKDANGNGMLDDGEETIGNTDVDQRWRDGSIKEATFTDPEGHYEYPTAEGGPLGKWIINEQGFARFSAYPGASVHDEYTGAVMPSCAVEPPEVPVNPCVPNEQGGGLLMNQLLTEGHRATVDWGKRDYPEGTPGQIVGVTYLATTRNEFQAFLQAHEDYEPGIPDVTVLLEGLGDDGLANTDDDTILNKYVTDHWEQPKASQDPQSNGNTFTQNCNPIRDFSGADVTGQFKANIGPECLEVPLNGEETKDGAFDGGYAFADYCPNGYDMAADDGTCTGGTEPQPLVEGTYIVHVLMPTDASDSRPCNPDGESQRISEPHGDVPGGGTGCLYRVVREEDVNVDLGDNFEPAIPPPPCNGDTHVIDQSSLVDRSPYFGQSGAEALLCDKHVVELVNGQNFNADFNLMTNLRTDPNGSDAADERIGDVAPPGRLVGQVFNDIYFERNPQSPWYGEPRPIGGIPVGIYARVDVAHNSCTPAVGTTCITGREIGRDGANAPTVTYDSSKWRLLKTVTTSPDGSFEALVPSTQTFNCPIPQGPCPGMYLVTVDDPGSKEHPNANYNPNLLTATTPADAWPGLTTQLDLPLDPISGTACEDPAVEPRPELLQVSTPIVQNGSRTIQIKADFIGTQGPPGAGGGRITLTDARTGQVQTLFRANGGVVSWTPGSGSTPDTIVISVPALGSQFRPGPKQLTITTANQNGGVSSVNGITIHVLGSNTVAGNIVTYQPNVVNVPAPPPAGANAHALQDAIDSAPLRSLLVLSQGVYNENVLVWKPLQIQGLGPGGIIGGHELQARDPEDPRFQIPGSVIDGRFFAENAATFDGTVITRGPFAVDPTLSTILRGADMTVVAKTPTAYDLATTAGVFSHAAFSAARIDGLGLTTGHGDGAGGIQLQAHINNMQLTNDVLENNGGIFAGGIGVGQPGAYSAPNKNVRVANDRLIGNGSLTYVGGVGIFYGSDNYEVANSIACSNFSVNYAGGVGAIGLSPGGSIHDNQIYYNDAVDSGGGIAIESELLPGSPGPATLGTGTGAVDVDRNLIQSNFSGDDGGGIYVLDALNQPINVRNNMIVNNGAATIGGAITLVNSSQVRIVNNTIANNVSTGSSETSAVGVPHSAGLAAEANDSAWQTDTRYTTQYPTSATRPDFSNPTALFNNIFWQNNAFTLDRFGPGAALVDQGFIDFEVQGTTNDADTFTPRYSILTNGQILGPNGVQHALPGGQGNLIGADPAFLTPFVNELTVAGSRLDPQFAAVTITGADPPVGLTGDYHIGNGSPAIDRGAGFSTLAVPAPASQAPVNPPASGPPPGSVLAPCSGTLAQLGSGTGYPADFDRQWRPQTRTLRVRTPWDMGADELAGVPNPIPLITGPLTFNWNNAGHLLCSASTETR
jgi:polysaccharide lyase family 4-like protein